MPSKSALLKITVSLVLVITLFFSIDRAALVANFTLLNLKWVPLILFLVILNYIISSFRWKQLLTIYKNSRGVSVGYLINLYFIGSFFNNFMPTSVGGDVYKIYKLGKKLGSKSDAFGATFMERFSGVAALVFIAIFGFATTFLGGIAGFENNFYLLGLIVISLVFGFALGSLVGLKTLRILSGKFSKIDAVYTSLISYKGQGRVVLIAFLTSFVVQLVAIGTQYLIFVALGTQLDIFRALFIFPLITLAGFFVPSLNGIGVQDFLYKFSNSFLFVAAPTAVAASIFYHIARLLVSLIGGVLYALGKAD